MSKRPKKQSAPEPQAVLDRTNISWADTKALGLLQSEYSEMSRDDFNNISEYIEAQADLLDRMQYYLARVVVSIPDEWLVSDAPDNLDWNDPESLNWVQGQKIQDLLLGEGDASEGN